MIHLCRISPWGLDGLIIFCNSYIYQAYGGNLCAANGIPGSVPHNFTIDKDMDGLVELQLSRPSPATQSSGIAFRTSR